MAVKLDEFPSVPSQARHEWDLLLNGEIWKLSRGEDFHSKPTTFIGNARLQAKRRGGVLRTRMLGKESLVIQFRRVA